VRKETHVWLVVLYVKCLENCSDLKYNFAKCIDTNFTRKCGCSLHRSRYDGGKLGVCFMIVLSEDSNKKKFGEG
jgi:hypothetical protein